MPSIGVLTSGKDSQGMNSALRAVVRIGIQGGHKIFFIKDSFEGLIEDKIELATWESVTDIMKTGGTIIGTKRCEDFRQKKHRKRAAQNMFQRGIFCLICIGGDGSLTALNVLKTEWSTLRTELLNEGSITAAQSQDGADIKVVGIVATIDNKFAGTDRTIGSDSALARIMETVDAVSSTSGSHQRTFIVEVVGRDSGHLALTASIALEADYAFIPEYPADTQWPALLCTQLENSRKMGRQLHIIILSEGAKDKDGNSLKAEIVQQAIVDKLKHDTRITQLGHVQRGGSPTYLDRMLGCRMGAEAIRLMEDDDKDPQVVCLKGHTITNAHLVEFLANTRQGLGVAIGKSASYASSLVVLTCQSAAVLSEFTTSQQASSVNLQLYDIKISKEGIRGEFKLAGALRGENFDQKSTIVEALAVAPDAERLGPCRTYAVLHIGAPAAGMNSATHAFVRMAAHFLIKVLAVEGSWDGLKKEKIKELTWSSVTGWLGMGGSKLGTQKQLPTDMQRIAQVAQDFNIDGFLLIGGLEAYHSALIIQKSAPEYTSLQIPVVVIPVSISNNLPGTCVSLGSDTALNELCRQVDNIKQSGISSQNRVMLVETMGGKCGYLPVMTALTTGSDAVLLSEKDCEPENIKEIIKEVFKRQKRGIEKFEIIKCDGASDFIDIHAISDVFSSNCDDKFSTRVNVIGHGQEGGAPSAFDRQMGLRCGIRALKGMMDPQRMDNGSFCCMLGIVGKSLTFTGVQHLEQKCCLKHRVPLNQWWLTVAPLIKQLTEPPEVKEA